MRPPGWLARRCGKLATATLGVVALAALVPASAGAHAFLLRTSPPPGARLDASPTTLRLFFSEPFVSGSERLTLTNGEGAAIPLAKPSAEGETLVQRLPPHLRGVYVVGWRAVSADDGHLSAGEFAFGVRSGAALPATTSSQATPASQVIFNWILFAGLALAFGGLVGEELVWRRLSPPLAVDARAPVGAAIVVAAVCAAGLLVALAGEQGPGGLDGGLAPDALGWAMSGRSGALTAAGLVALLAAGALVGAGWRRLALVPVAAAVVARGLWGHAAATGDEWAVAASVVHLTLVVLWVGMLAHVVVIVARHRSRPARAALEAGVRGYSRLALPSVLAILASGGVVAFAELSLPGELISSAYGRTLLIKSGLVALALLFALTSRRRALAANPGLRLPLLRRLTRGELGTLSLVLGAAALLVNTAPPVPAATAPSPVLGPPPLGGEAVRLGGLGGNLAVGLEAGRRQLRFTIVAPEGKPAAGARLEADLETPRGAEADLFPRPCGDGCFTIRHRLSRGVNLVTASVSAPGWAGGKVRFRVPSPPPAAQPQLLGRVARKMAEVPRLALVERVTSGPGSHPTTTRVQLTGRAFMRTETFGAGAEDVRVIGHRHGEPELAFALPGSNLWYRMAIDGSDRIASESIVSPGHLIRRSFRYPSAQ